MLCLKVYRSFWLFSYIPAPVCRCNEKYADSFYNRCTYDWKKGEGDQRGSRTCLLVAFTHSTSSATRILVLFRPESLQSSHVSQGRTDLARQQGLQNRPSACSYFLLHCWWDPGTSRIRWMVQEACIAGMRCLPRLQ